MKTVNGIFASANIFNDDVENYAVAQIQMLCDNEAAKGSKIRVMPDVHPGKVGTIGLTMTVGEQIMPNLVGIDIGCGITLAKLKQKKAEFQKLDTVIREQIPAGAAVRRKAHRYSETFDFSRLRCYRSINLQKSILSLGTLGGGNHFIELDKAEDGALYVAIHSGSRHLGKEVTEYYLKQGQKSGAASGKEVPYELTVLDGSLMEDYLHDQRIVQEYAALNREIMLEELAKGMKWKVEKQISCVHNYIEVCDGGAVQAGAVQAGTYEAGAEPGGNYEGRTDENGFENQYILRKGAISAKKGEKVVIPINMRDGILLGVGKGNAEWNDSAPHGSGRILKRTEVGNCYTVSDFKREMKGIYCACISKDTLDEAPFAYRAMTEIVKAVEDTVEITGVLKPVYNYKAGN